ncbi:ribonuclease H protein, partial [Trifolium medium]|nr:ribonuclease H protein [Trifolium medium]
MFSSSNPVGMDLVCRVVNGRLSTDHIERCNHMFTKEEVKDALDQMHPLKAPGPDGLPAIFFQKYWNIVGNEIQELVLSILNEGQSPGCINKTFIALIPKCKNPSSPK